MTAPHPDQQQLWTELTATMIRPLIAIACNPDEEPARQQAALHIAHETSPDVCMQALVGLAQSAISALSASKGASITQMLGEWAQVNAKID